MLPHTCDKLWDNKTKGGLFSTEHDMFLSSEGYSTFEVHLGFCFLEVKKCFWKRQQKIWRTYY